MPAGFSDLDYTVHAALRLPKTMAGLRSDPGVSNALRRLSDQLAEEGLLLSPARRRVARLAALVMFAVLALAVARLVAGLSNHKPVGFLVLVAVPTIPVTFALLGVPTVSRAGRKLLARLRRGNRHLLPSQSPSWATYGAAGAMLGVALYGTSALWAADPAFAAQAGITQASAGSSSWSGGGSSCSSGDSGGSSCGGGGGCGGGGCGG